MNESSPQLTRLPALQKQLGGVSRVTIWRMRREKNFPQPITISGNCIAWDQSEIDKWIADRAKERAPAIAA